MPSGGADPGREAGALARLRAAIEPILARAMAWPPIAAGRRIMARYDAAGGGLLAGGLAYAALFAIVPGVLLMAGLVGLLVTDAARREDAITFIAAVLPPIHDLVRATLDEAGSNPGALGIIGAATLVWGASRFVLTFADTVARAMGRPRQRGLFVRNGAAIVVVLLLPFAIVAGAAMAGIASFLDAAEQQGVVAVVGAAVHLVLGLVPAAVSVLVVSLVYRIVPTPVAPWRALWLPAVVVAAALYGLLEAFVFVAPRLIGAAALLGTIATVFAALAWLSLSFQAVLIGAAWVGDREDRAAPANR